VKRRSWIRRTLSGQFGTKAEELSDPAGTVRETFKPSGDLLAAAEHLLSYCDYADRSGNYHVPEAALTRLRFAVKENRH